MAGLPLIVLGATALGNLLLPVMFAFGVWGRHLALALRTDVRAEAGRVVAPAVDPAATDLSPQP